MIRLRTPTRRHALNALLTAILALTACSSLTITPPTASPEAQTGPTPTTGATPTLYVLPTLPPSPTPSCLGAPRERLILQARGRVLPDDPRPINLRSGPGTDNRILVLMPVRATFLVLEGPVCSGGFAWFRVRYEGQEGWLAEGDANGYYVEPYLVE